MFSKQQIIEYFMKIMSLEKEMEYESAFMLNDVPNGELKQLISTWHDDEARHVQIAQKILEIAVKELGNL